MGLRLLILFSVATSAATATSSFHQDKALFSFSKGPLLLGLRRRPTTSRRDLVSVISSRGGSEAAAAAAPEDSSLSGRQDEDKARALGPAPPQPLAVGMPPPPPPADDKNAAKVGSSSSVSATFKFLPRRWQPQPKPPPTMSAESISTTVADTLGNSSSDASSPATTAVAAEGALVATATTTAQPAGATTIASEPSADDQSEAAGTANDVARKEEDPRIMFLIRLLFLAYYGSLGSIMPYLPVYYHSLGHGGQIIGLLGAVKPFTTFLVAPVWGAISDETHNPFFILQLTFCVSCLGQLLVGARDDPVYIMGMVFLTALFNAPVKSLLDSMVMDNLHNAAQSYGRLRLWGQLGFGLGSSGVGYLLSRSHSAAAAAPPVEDNETMEASASVVQAALRYIVKGWNSLTGYKLLFLAYATLSIPAWILIKAFERFDREKSKESQAAAEAAVNDGSNAPKQQAAAKKKRRKEGDLSVGHGLRLVLRNPDALLFFFLVLAIGVSSGVIENFAYVRIREVGGTGTEMGISRLVSSLAGAPMFWFAGKLSAWSGGVDRILVVSLLSYALRFGIYASMTHAYHGLPAEALRGITFAAFWSSATIYAHTISPAGLHATMLMLVNAMYGGLGQSLGAIIGGKLQHAFGTAKTFWYAAMSDLALVGCVFSYLLVRREASNFRDPQPIVAASRRADAPPPTTAVVAATSTTLERRLQPSGSTPSASESSTSTT